MVKTPHRRSTDLRPFGRFCRQIGACACFFAFLVFAMPSNAARPGTGTKILVEDDNTLDVEQAFLRPARRDRYELSLTTAANLAASKGMTAPIGAAMLQGDGVLRAAPVTLVGIVRLRLDDLSSLRSSTKLFFHQFYLSVTHPLGEVKIGKVMGQLGRLWDYGLYGPLLANSDFKLTPDLGISFEGELGQQRSYQLAYALQYSVVDGRSIAIGNPGLFESRRVRRQNIMTLRVVPIYQAPSGFRLGLGVSGQAYQAHQHNNRWIGRGALDVQWQTGPLEAFFEIGRQEGEDTPTGADAPVGSFNYAWAGAQLELARTLHVRHHVNVVRFSGSHPVTDVLQQPGIEYQPDPRVTLVLEGAFWTSNNVVPRGEKTLYAFAILSL